MLNINNHEGNAYLTTMNNTTHILKFRSLTRLTVGEDLNKLELLYPIVANVKWYHYENYLATF